MLAVAAFAAWTVFVWATRVSNVLRDDASALDLVLAAAVTGLGVLVAVATLRRRPQWPLVALVVVTVATWAVRTPPLLLDAEHGAAFKAVHLALAVVSLGLAAAAWRSRGVLAARPGHVPQGSPGR